MESDVSDKFSGIQFAGFLYFVKNCLFAPFKNYCVYLLLNALGPKTSFWMFSDEA